jgi:hypothetical protein
VQSNDGHTALDVATTNYNPPLVQFLTSASLLVTNNDYSSLRTLCAPYSSSPTSPSTSPANSATPPS